MHPIPALKCGLRNPSFFLNVAKTKNATTRNCNAIAPERCQPLVIARARLIQQDRREGARSARGERKIEQVVEGPKIVSQDRIHQRTHHQISDIPVPQVVEELVGLRSLLPGWGSTAFCGADFRNSRNITK